MGAMFNYMSWALSVPLRQSLNLSLLIDRPIWLVPLGVRYAHSPGIVLPAPPQLTSLDTLSDVAEARSWISKFKALPIPKSFVEMTFSRSSGPGGQNVNKVNTKATLRCSVDAHWIPIWARIDLRKSSYYAASSRSLVITSTVHRSQSQNIDDCLSKLHSLIVSASSASVKSEPTEEQKKRVATLEKAEKQRKMQDKIRRSAIKKGRAAGKKGGGWD